MKSHTITVSDTVTLIPSNATRCGMMRIMKKRVLSPVGRLQVRVGRRAIASTRMHRTLEARGTIKPSKRRMTFRRPKYQFTKLHLGIACGVVLLLIGSSAATMRLLGTKRVSGPKLRLCAFKSNASLIKKAATCRADVVKSKTDQIGKATYGELYGTSC